MNDLKGRPWATVAQVKVGSKLEADGDFTCIKKGTVLTVEDSKNGLSVPCKEGGHLLDGQLSDDGTHYVGLYCVAE